MVNPVIANVDNGSPYVEKGPFRDDEVTFGGAGTEPAGTIMARDSVSLLLVPFVKGGATNENGIPKAVLHEDVTAAGAGDEPIRIPQSGTVNKDRLIIKADGDDTNVDAAVIDELRDYGITAKDYTNLSQLDNQ